MKKFLSIILSITLLMSMSVTAFAADERIAEQKVSVKIPMPEYAYTVTMPKDCSLTYGNTDWQFIGGVTVTSENWNNINSAYEGVIVSWSTDYDNTLKNSNGDSINFNHDVKYHHDPNRGFLGTGAIIFNADMTIDQYMQVRDWSEAVEGTTYSKTITYTAKLEEIHV